MNTAIEPPAIGRGQFTHFAVLGGLLVVTALIWHRMGQPAPVAFWVAVAMPIAHQLYVWLAWRLELNTGVVSRTIGLRGYVVCFFLLFGARFVSLVYLAWLDRGQLGLPQALQILLTTALLLPGCYAMYSVHRYFGMTRAAGADHFDPHYRTLPLVKEGIFRFTRNGMYWYAFMLFWAIAVGFNSSAALLVAAFSHAYIWVHFHTLEKLDMAYIYAD